jgi:hypothetical protein
MASQDRTQVYHASYLGVTTSLRMSEEEQMIMFSFQSEGYNSISKGGGVKKITPDQIKSQDQEIQ